MTPERSGASPWLGLATLGLVAGLTQLHVEAVVLTTTMVYGLNFAVTGPNATAALVGLLVTGWSVGVAPASWRRLWAGAGVGLSVGLVAAALGGGVVATLGGAVVATATTPPLVALLGRLRERTAVGVAGGLLLTVGLRTVAWTAPPFATTVGTAALFAVAVAVAALAAALARADSLPGAPSAGTVVSAAPLGALAVGAAVLLAAPATAARWSARPYAPTVLASVAGLVAGGCFVAVRGVPSRPAAAAFAAAYLVGAVVLVWGSGPASVLGAGLAPLGALGLLAVGSRERAWRSTRRTALGLALTQAAALATTFLFVVAVNWPFLPGGLGSAVSGLDDAFLFATLLVLPLAVVTGVRETAGWDTPVAGGRRNALATVGAGVLAAVGLARPAASPDESSDADRGSLTVATYNVHQFLDAEGATWNLGAVRSVLAEADADVVGLQETEGTRVTSGGVDGVRWLAGHLGYHVRRGLPTRAGSYGVALLSRWPITDARTVALPARRSPTRPALLATVEHPDGDVPTLVTHFQTQQRDWGTERTRRAIAAQGEQADRVVDLVGPADRAIVLGDFNARPGDDAYERLAGVWTDAWRAGNPDAVAGAGYTWPADDPDRRIDHVFVGDGWRVRSATVTGGPAASDHRAVVTRLAPSDTG